MSERRARYVGGSQTGVDITIELSDGSTVARHVPHGGEVPRKIGEASVPAAYIDSLLEQGDNWTEVKRAVGKPRAKKPRRPRVQAAVKTETPPAIPSPAEGDGEVVQ